MITFLKAQGSSLLATAADYTMTFILFGVFGVWFPSAHAVGLVCGGIVNFLINRDWVFNGPGQRLRMQVARYFLVWCGNWLLNGIGVYLLVLHTDWNPFVSKVAVALLVGWTYNYLLQKKYVFK